MPTSRMQDVDGVAGWTGALNECSGFHGPPSRRCRRSGLRREQVGIVDVAGRGVVRGNRPHQVAALPEKWGSPGWCHHIGAICRPAGRGNSSVEISRSGRAGPSIGASSGEGCQGSLSARIGFETLDGCSHADALLEKNRPKSRSRSLDRSLRGQFIGLGSCAAS